jgi:WS/DGAT/MGAT family acyltransferase
VAYPAPSAAARTTTRARFDDRLNASDALLWTIERDPALRTTIVAIAMLDRAPNWELLRRRFLEASLVAPRFRQRVVESPLRLGAPRWEFDDDFDIDYHLRRVRAPEPGGLETVLRLAEPITMAAFDKARPLWEFTLVEGLADGRAALIEKIHHSVTDGVGGVLLAALVVDKRRRGSTRAASPVDAVPTPHPRPSGAGAVVAALAGVAEAAADEVRTAMSIAASASRAVPRLSAGAALRPGRFAADAVRGARSVARLLTPAPAPLSPVMRGRGRSRRLAAFDVPLEDLRAAARAGGGTLNDAFLAAVAGGMRRYHARHGAATDSLRVTMPVSLRGDEDTIGNNRFAPARFTLPIEAATPREHMARLGAIARRWRREPALGSSNVIAGALNRLPPAATTAVFGSLLKGVDLVATNVPGFRERVYLAGAEVLAHYAFPPPSGAACGIAFMSHGDRGCVGVTIDADAIPDPQLLRECLAAGFADVLASAAEE